MDWNQGGWGAGDWVAMSAMMLLFWGALIGLIVWITRRVGGIGDRRWGSRATDADAMLAERFARGEIDYEEFARGRELLHSGAVTSVG